MEVVLGCGRVKFGYRCDREEVVLIVFRFFFLIFRVRGIVEILGEGFLGWFFCVWLTFIVSG